MPHVEPPTDLVKKVLLKVFDDHTFKHVEKYKAFRRSFEAQQQHPLLKGAFKEHLEYVWLQVIVMVTQQHGAGDLFVSLTVMYNTVKHCRRHYAT